MARKTVAAGIAWGTIARVVQVATQFLATAALARLLAPGDFGLVNMATVALAIANALADFGVRSYVLHRPSPEAREIETAKAVSLMLGGAVLGVAMLTAWPVAEFYGEPRLIPILIVQATVYVVSSAGVVHSAMIARRFGFRRMAIAECAASLAYLVAALTLATSGAGYWSLVLGRVASSVVALIVVTFREGSILPRECSAEHMARVARFGGVITGAGLLTQVDENFDNIVVGRFLGAESLGTYAVAYNVAALPQRYLAYMVAGVAGPVIARVDGASLAAAVRKYARYQVLGPGALAVGISVMAPEATAVLLGPKWAQAAPLIRVMGLSTAVLAVGTVIGGSLIARGDVRPLLTFHAAKLGATVVGVTTGLLHGMMGVAWGFFASTVISVLVGLRLVETRLRVSGVLRSCVGPATVVALAASAAWASRSVVPVGSSSPVGVLAVAGLTYVVALVAGAVISLKDVRRDLWEVGLQRLGRWLARRSGPR